jgi:hypothetical protein
MNLENMFCEINPDRRNLHGGRLLSVGVPQRPQFGIQMPERGPSTPSGQILPKWARRTKSFDALPRLFSARRANSEELV